MELEKNLMLQKAGVLAKIGFDTAGTSSPTIYKFSPANIATSANLPVKAFSVDNVLHLYT